MVYVFMKIDFLYKFQLTFVYSSENNTACISSENKVSHIVNTYVKHLTCMSALPAAMRATAYGYLVIFGHLETFNKRPREIFAILSLLLFEYIKIGSMFLYLYTLAVVFWALNPLSSEA